MQEDPKLYIPDVITLLAERGINIQPATWRRYYADPKPGRRRTAPPPDGVDPEKGHARPWWRRSTITGWIATRPGPGARTDLSDPRPTDSNGVPDQRVAG